MKALVLNGSLKQRPTDSTTQVLCEMFARETRKKGADTEIVFLNDLEIAPGVGIDPEDDMHELFAKVWQSDILVLATPIWWNQPSSLIQKVLERMTAFDDYYIQTDRSLLYGKVLGVLVTGTDDGSQSCMARLLCYGSQLGFTVPPEAFATYQGKEEDRKIIEANEDTRGMVEILARNLVAWHKAMETSGIGNTVQRGTTDRKGTVAADARRLKAILSADLESDPITGVYLKSIVMRNS